MFDARVVHAHFCPNIQPNYQLGSRFDQEQVIGFQMSLFSGILYSKRWKFVRWVFALPKREVIPCLRLECVASTSSKLLERAFLDGFRAGKQERPAPAGSRSVARWKNNSCCISNIIRRFPGMDVVI